MTLRSVTSFATRKELGRNDDPGIAFGGIWKKASVLFTLILLLTASAIHAQQPELLGKRVRLSRVDGKKIRGTLVHLTPEQVHLQRDSEGPLVLDRSQLVRVERSLGRQRHFDRFFMLGFFASVGFGAIIDAAALGSGPGPSFAVIGGALVGVPVGVVAGTLFKTEGWEPIELAVRPEFPASAFPIGRFGVSCAVPVSW